MGFIYCFGCALSQNFLIILSVFWVFIMFCLWILRCLWMFLFEKISMWTSLVTRVFLSTRPTFSKHIYFKILLVTPAKSYCSKFIRQRTFQQLRFYYELIWIFFHLSRSWLYTFWLNKFRLKRPWLTETQFCLVVFVIFWTTNIACVFFFNDHFETKICIPSLENCFEM